MALNAVCCQVRPRQRKTGIVVVKSIVAAAGRVTSQTSRVVVSISVDAIVLIVRFRIRMAGRTAEFHKIARVGMAIYTSVPFAIVRTTVNGEVLVVVVQRGRRPGIFAVAGRTIC